MFCLHSDLTAKVQCFSVILNYLMHLPNFAVIKSIFQKIINKTSCTHRGHASSLWNNEGLIVDWYNIYLYLIKIFIKIMKHNSYYICWAIFIFCFDYQLYYLLTFRGGSIPCIWAVILHVQSVILHVQSVILHVQSVISFYLGQHFKSSYSLKQILLKCLI